MRIFGRRRHCWLWLIVACILLSAASAQDARPGPEPTGDEADLRALAHAFYSTFANRDANAFVRLWSNKAPDLAARTQATEKLFAANEKIEAKDLVIRRLVIESARATLRIAVEINGTEAKTGKPTAGLGKLIRTLEGVKEDGQWKVWREAEAEDDLAAALAALPGDAERSSLLRTENELVNERLVRALTRQGSNLGSGGKFPESLANFRLALGVAEQIQDKAGIADALNGIGSVLNFQGDYDQALEQFQKCLGMSEALGDRARVAMALKNIGAVYFRRGDYTQAQEHYQKSLVQSEGLENKSTLADTLNNLGLLYSTQGDYARALEHYQRSLSLREKLGDTDSLARLLFNIGLTHNLLGDYAPALSCFQNSLSYFESTGNKVGMAAALNTIGVVRYKQGDYARAIENYRKSLRLYEELRVPSGIARTLMNMGVVYYEQGDYAQALEEYQRSLAQNESGGDEEGRAQALNNIGNVYKSQGEYDQALAYYQKSLTAFEAMKNNDEIARVIGNIGLVYCGKGDSVRGHEHFRKSLAIRESLGDKQGIAMTLSNIAEAYVAEGNAERALDFANRASALARQINSPEILWRGQYDAGQAHRTLNQLPQARQAFEEAIRAIETLRDQVAGAEQERQRFFEEKVLPYHATVELLLAQNQAADALFTAERAKARVLIDVLQSGRVDVDKAMSAAEKEGEQKLYKQLVSLNTQISRENPRSPSASAHLEDLRARQQKARLEYEAFQTGLYVAHPELKAQRGKAEPLTLEQARNLLPDAQGALLEYVVTDEKTYLFVMTENSAGTDIELKVYPLEIKRRELGDRAEKFREMLAKGSPGFREPARELYDLLLKPAAAQLRGKTALIVVPDGRLWELPFQALQPAPNRYLLEDAAIAYAPSLTALREMHRLRDRKKSAVPAQTLLAFGNPTMGAPSLARARSARMDETLGPLPEAERQVATMRQIYGPTQSRIYTGAEAHEERAKAEAGAYRILHLATHGILNDGSPMYSHLLLAPAEGDAKEDGLLEAWEIMNLDLKADLTVLSACETARGRFGAGEGVIGLSWALFVAGCPASVVSQWKVDSSGTTELMLEFHRRLKAQMESPSSAIHAARALREAALKVQGDSRYKHPFYWAGFVTTGKGF